MIGLFINDAALAVTRGSILVVKQWIEKQMIVYLTPSVNVWTTTATTSGVFSTDSDYTVTY